MFERIKHAGLGLILLAMTWAAQPGFSKGSNVQFHGTVTRVDLATASTAAITLRVSGFNVAIQVTTDTEVETHGDELELSDIKVSDFVKVSGFFANSSITATEITIVDRGDGEFRLRGPITAVRPVPTGTLITVLGIDLLIDADTKLDRRGPNDSFTVANLAVNQTVDARGSHIDGQFVADRVRVGNRDEDPIRINFEGKISALSSGRLTIDTEGGSSAIVLIGSTTLVTGTPEIGRFVEVHGTLNSSLQVVATRVKVKLNKDDDDAPPPRPITKFEKKIRLLPIGSVSSISGEAEVKYEQKGQEIEQEFKLNFKHGLANTDYIVRVELAGTGAISFGTVRTNRDGQGDLKLKAPSSSGQSGLTTLLPSGKTVRDITKVQVLTAGNIAVAEGVF